MEINGKVVEIEKGVLITGKNGDYKGSKIIFKDSTGKVQEKAFHENTFKYNKAFEKELHALSAGDSFVATLEKKGEYWNWLSIKKSTGETQPMAKPATTGGNWETAEERKNKQVYIIRQSSISAALKFAELQKDFFKGTTNPLGEVLNIADELTNWVLGQSQVTEKKGAAKAIANALREDNIFDSLENDIPY